MNISIIEPLESRIAPAAVLNISVSADHKTATWTDVDGDLVTLKATKGSLNESLFHGNNGSDGVQINQIDLTDSLFNGASVSIIAKRAVTSKNAIGNGTVDVGYINAAGNSLGSFIINGDLGRIDAGASILTAKTSKAIISIKAHSLNMHPTLPDGVSANSEINGSVGSITIRGGVYGTLNVTGDSFGKIGTLAVGNIIGGSNADSGRIVTTGDIGKVVVAGNIIGGSGQHSGSIESSGNILSVLIGGSISGGRSANPSTDGTGVVRADGNIGSVSVGSIYGGTQQDSGLISSGKNLGVVKVLGGIYGGTAGQDNGGIFADGNAISISIKGDVRGGAAQHSGFIKISGSSGAVSVGGNVLGGSGDYSAKLEFGTLAIDKLASLNVRDVFGGSGDDSGYITVAGKTGAIILKGNLTGGAGGGAGKIFVNGAASILMGDIVGGSGSDTGVLNSTGLVNKLTFSNLVGGDSSNSGVINLKNAGLIVGREVQGGNIASDATDDVQASGAIYADSILSLSLLSVRTGDDLNANFDLKDNASIRVANNIVSLNVKLGLFGTQDTHVVVSARGEASPVLNSGKDIAFKTITIGTSQYSDIYAGYNNEDSIEDAESNPDAQISQLVVKGDWVASNAVAGVKWSDSFGDGDDVKSLGVDNPSIVSRIAAISIAGSISGTSVSGDSFGFVAQSVGSFRFGGPKPPAPVVVLPPGTIPVPVDPHAHVTPTTVSVLLNPGSANDNDPNDLRYSVSNSGNVRIFEFAL